MAHSYSYLGVTNHAFITITALPNAGKEIINIQLQKYGPDNYFIRKSSDHYFSDFERMNKRKRI
jgi:hypothetical protein